LRRIKDRGKGIGRIGWRVNGVTAAVSHAPEGAPDATVEQTLVLDPGDNNIEVVAYNARNILASPPARAKMTFSGSADAAKPNLHVLVIGINAYHDTGWRRPGSDVVELFPPLTLAAGDARSFAMEMQRAARDFYRDVRITTLIDTDATPAKIESTSIKFLSAWIRAILSSSTWPRTAIRWTGASTSSRKTTMAAPIPML
jgi:hypothetical protein